MTTMIPLIAATLLSIALLDTSKVSGISENEFYQKHIKTRRMKHIDIHAGKYPKTDYNNTHPYELMARQRLRLRGRHLNPAELEDYNPEVEDEDPNLSDPETRFNRDFFQPIRIRADFLWLRYDIKEEFVAKNDFIKFEVLPAAIKFWSRAIKVFPVRRLFIPPEYCYTAKESHIMQGIKKTDLMLYINTLDDCEEGMFGFADSCDWDQYDRPTAGIINFCYDAIRFREDGSVPASSKAVAIETAIHEIGHVLGLRSRDIAYFYDMTTGLPRTEREEDGNVKQVDVTCIHGGNQFTERPAESTLREGRTDYGVRYFEVVTPTVKKVVRNFFNCPTLQGARLENQPTSNDCYGDHWEERLFFDEVMSGVAINGNFPEFISPLTFALLEDSGWYLTDYSRAKVSPFGHGAGCDFVNSKCIEDGRIPNYSKGYFCNSMDRSNNFRCDPTHTAIAACDAINFIYYPNLPRPPSEYQYFPLKTLGGKEFRADYCPTWSHFIYTCKKDTLAKHLHYPNEIFGPNSRCLNTFSETQEETRPACMDTFCDSQQQAVVVALHDQNVTCEREGQTFPLTEVVSFVCPKLSAMCPDMVCPGNCAGRGICDWSQSPPECICDDPTDTTPGCTATIPTQSFIDVRDDMDETEEYGTFVTRVKGEFQITVNLMQELTIEDVKLVAHALTMAMGMLMSKGTNIRVVSVNGIKLNKSEDRLLQQDTSPNDSKVSNGNMGGVPHEEALNVEFEVVSTQTCETAGCEDIHDKEEHYFEDVSNQMKKVSKGNNLKKAIEKEAEVEGIVFLKNVAVDTKSIHVNNNLQNNDPDNGSGGGDSAISVDGRSSMTSSGFSSQRMAPHCAVTAIAVYILMHACMNN